LATAHPQAQEKLLLLESFFAETSWLCFGRPSSPSSHLRNEEKRRLERLDQRGRERLPMFLLHSWFGCTLDFRKDQGLSPSEEDLDTDEVIAKSLEIMGGQSWLGMGSMGMQKASNFQLSRVVPHDLQESQENWWKSRRVSAKAFALPYGLPALDSLGLGVAGQSLQIMIAGHVAGSILLPIHQNSVPPSFV